MSEEMDTLRQVFAEVAENLAFMFAEVPEEDEFPEAEPPCMLAQMSFLGPFNGKLYIAVPQHMCPEIAANVLGLDPDDELVVKQPTDALKELLNVTCGNLLTTMAGEDPIFDLTPPEVVVLDKKGWDDFAAAPGTVRFIVDENPVLLRMEKQ